MILMQPPSNKKKWHTRQHNILAKYIILRLKNRVLFQNIVLVLNELNKWIQKEYLFRLLIGNSVSSLWPFDECDMSMHCILLIMIMLVFAR